MSDLVRDDDRQRGRVRQIAVDVDDRSLVVVHAMEYRRGGLEVNLQRAGRPGAELGRTVRLPQHLGSGDARQLLLRRTGIGHDARRMTWIERICDRRGTILCRTPDERYEPQRVAVLHAPTLASARASVCRSRVTPLH